MGCSVADGGDEGGNVGEDVNVLGVMNRGKEAGLFIREYLRKVVGANVILAGIVTMGELTVEGLNLVEHWGCSKVLGCGCGTKGQAVLGGAVTTEVMPAFRVVGGGDEGKLIQGEKVWGEESLEAIICCTQGVEDEGSGTRASGDLQFIGFVEFDCDKDRVVVDRGEVVRVSFETSFNEGKVQ